jgi:uncharacterized membrane protein YhaH (DUF805 family)
MSDTWYYADQSGRVGPFGLQELKARLGKIPNARDLYVWRAGFADWKRVGDVAELGGDGAQTAPSFAPSDFAGAAGMGSRQDLVNLWFGFRGRINRAKFWLVALINTAILMVGAGLAFATGSTIVWALFGLFYIVVLVSGLSITIRRLHDRDKSGWWALVFFVAPALLSGIGAALGSSLGLGASIFSLASLAISIWAFIELGCLRGTQGPNQFGPDPLAGRSS